MPYNFLIFAVFPPLFSFDFCLPDDAEGEVKDRDPTENLGQVRRALYRPCANVASSPGSTQLFKVARAKRESPGDKVMWLVRHKF